MKKRKKKITMIIIIKRTGFKYQVIDYINIREIFPKKINIMLKHLKKIKMKAKKKI